MTISNAHLIPCFTFCIPLSHLSHSCVPVVANDRSADLCYLLLDLCYRDRKENNKQAISNLHSPFTRGLTPCLYAGYGEGSFFAAHACRYPSIFCAEPRLRSVRNPGCCLCRTPVEVYAAPRFLLMLNPFSAYAEPVCGLCPKDEAKPGGHSEIRSNGPLSYCRPTSAVLLTYVGSIADLRRQSCRPTSAIDSTHAD